VTNLSRPNLHPETDRRRHILQWRWWALTLQEHFGGQVQLLRGDTAELDIGESRFFAQRAEWLEKSLDFLEPGAPGRPAKPELPPEQGEVDALREQVRQLEARLAAAEVRSELACLLPRLAGDAFPRKKK